MAEFLVMAVPSSHPDPEKARRGIHQKGDPVVAQPDGHVWGAKEGLPKFVLVKCPELSLALARERIAEWAYAVVFTVVGSQLPIDGHRIRMSNANVGVSGAAGLTLEKVQSFLTEWGCVFVSAAPGTVTFDVLVTDMALSAGFWGGPPSVRGITITEVGYVQATGLHTFEAEYATSPVWLEHPMAFEREVRNRIRSVGGTVLEEVNGVTTFTLTRNAVRDRFRQYVEQRLGTFQRHRYHFTEAQVDTVVAQGGEITLTLAQLSAAVRDRLAE